MIVSRPGPHNGLYQSVGVAIEGPTPHPSQDNMVVINHDASVPARSSEAVYDIAKPVTKMAANIATP